VIDVKNQNQDEPTELGFQQGPKAQNSWNAYIDIDYSTDHFAGEDPGL